MNQAADAVSGSPAAEVGDPGTSASAATRGGRAATRGGPARHGAGQSPTHGGYPSALHGATIAARLLAVLAIVVGALSFVIAAENGQTAAQLVQQNQLAPVVLGCGLAVVGAMVISQNPRNALAWLFCVQGQLQSWSSFGAAYALRDPQAPGAGVAAFLGAYAWLPGMLMLLTLTVPLFPDGRPPSRRWWPLVGAGIAVTAIGTVGMLLTDAPLREEFPSFRDPFALSRPAEQTLDALSGVVFAAAVALALIGVIGTIVRAVKMHGRQRGQSIALVVAFGIGVLGQVLNEVSPAITAVAWTVFVVALGAAMLRGGLYDGDRMLNRSLFYALCTAVIAAVVGLVAGLLGEVVGGATLGAVAAAVIVALAIDPVRRTVQRAVDSLLFGARRDPFSAVESLGRQLSAALAPEDALRAVVEAVTTGLRLPAASLTLTGEDAPAVAIGPMPANRVDLALEHSGEIVGTLTVGLPGSRRFLDPQDERLLTELARQAGAAADSVRLTRELRRSRDAVIAARDDERERIRRDLHDGLGPALAGVSLGIGAARTNVADTATASLLEQLRREVDQSLLEVRSLISALRPAVLETRGLAVALERHLVALAERTAGSPSLSWTIDVPELPDSVETAAYRIATEALTNATRHAHASHVRLDLRLDGRDLVLSVTDDGIGLAPTDGTAGPRADDGDSRADGAPGVGLTSMAQRAEDLGGRLALTAADGGGLVVTATIPVGGPA